MLNRDHYEFVPPNAEDLFNKIYTAGCQLEINPKDENARFNIHDALTEGANINILFANISPLGRLAKEKKYKAVDIFINEFNANIDDALECYAEVNDIDAANNLIEICLKQKKYNAIAVAILGATKGGQHALVQNLLTLGRDLHDEINDLSFSSYTLYNYTILGYAFINNTEKLNETRCMLHESSFRGNALEGFARAGNAEGIKNILRKYPKYLWHNFSNDPAYACESILRGYLIGGFVDRCIENGDTTILKLFAICNDAERKILVKTFDPVTVHWWEIPKVGPPAIPKPAWKVREENNLQSFYDLLLHFEELIETYHVDFKTAYKIHLFQSQYGLTLDQAHAWLLPELRLWLLEAFNNHQFGSVDNLFIPDIYFHIASLLTKCDEIETRKLFDKMNFSENKRLLLQKVKEILSTEDSKNSKFESQATFFRNVGDCKSKNELIKLLDQQQKDDPSFCSENIEKVQQRLSRLS